MQNLDAAAYKKYLNQDEKLPSMRKKIYCNYKIDSWPKITMESLNWLPFLNIMEFTADRINNY